MTSTKENLSAAMAAIGSIAKDRKNSFHGYDYMSEEAVKRAVQKALRDVGEVPKSITFPADLMRTWEYERKNKRYMCIMVTCRIEFDDGRVFEGLGCGEDSEDKAPMKAQTAAIRECWKNAFCIPSGGDPEIHEENPEPKPRPAPLPAADREALKEWASGIRALREPLGIDANKLSAISVVAFKAKPAKLAEKDRDKLTALLTAMDADTAKAISAATDDETIASLVKALQTNIDMGDMPTSYTGNG